MERTTTTSLFFLSFCLSFSFFLGHQARLGVAQNAVAPVDVGVVLDFGSLPGKKNWASISLALDDFYAVHRNVTRRIVLHRRDSRSDIAGAASAAMDLLKNVKAQAIIGPITSAQTEFVSILGNKAHVPIVSFSATSPSLSPLRTPYFVRATLNDSSQVPAIAAIVELHGWREVVPIYEDTDYASGIVPFLVVEFNSVDARIPYCSVVPSDASDAWLAAELYKLMSMQTRVFVVHMKSALGSRLFQQARAAGLMSPGYVWIVTDGLANLLDTLDPTVLESMEGVLGVRPYVPRSKALRSFADRWRARFSRDNPALLAAALPGPTVYQQWAYDATWAVALAAEKAGWLLNNGYDGPPRGAADSTDLDGLGVSKSGPAFLGGILGTQFRGLTGDFRLVDGQLQSSAFEIVNVMGRKGERRVGFWSPEVKIIKDLKASDAGLRTVIWPGDPKEVPKGWEIPTRGRKLTIGLPRKKGFHEFVDVERDNVTGRITRPPTGYSIDIFEEAMKKLPYYVPFEYEAFDSFCYDDLVNQVYLKRYDAVVGDTTITANRSLNVDFTLPYTESGVSMVVPVEEDKSKEAWIFLKPLKTDLWLASIAFFFFTGFVVWAIEHRINSEFRGPPSQQMGTIFYFVFSTLVFAHRERLVSNLSKFAVIIWVFVVLILTSSYTASLTSMLTVQQLQPSVTDISDLINNGDYIGCQDGSFVGGFLEHQLKVDVSKLRKYSNSSEYAQALSLGSKNGGVAAIVDEIPYLKSFLSESDNCQNFTMVGRTYKTDGFGFVFPRGSPLAPDVSRAILNVTQGGEMAGIEKKWFGTQTTCPSDMSSSTSSSLKFESFSGLFLITGCVSSLALLLFLITFLYKEWDVLKAAASQRPFWRKVVEWCRYYDNRDFSSPTFKDYAPSVNAGDGGSTHAHRVGDAAATPNTVDGSQSPISIYQSDLIFGSPDVVMRSFRERGEPTVEEPPAIELDDIRPSGEG